MSVASNTTADGLLLQPYREELDRINQRLVDLLAERMRICRHIARIKATHGIPMMQPQRIGSTLDQVRALSGSRQLRPEYVSGLFQLIIEETCAQELLIMAPGPDACAR